ncbi:MAG: rRNA pseudouridine synthase [Desulfovibrionales bacterium]|nr:MAG: rRNA pseudouridine synthase [Desulfovibrionales bacterium]
MHINGATNSPKSLTETPANASTGSHLVRLNKVLAQAGLCSRRAADDLILAGVVVVNGNVVASPGSRVDPTADRIMVHGRAVQWAWNDTRRQLYLAMHKPPGVVTTAHDPQKRRTVLDLLPENLRQRRPFPVGRLDLPSEGLLLLTTDGELALRMTHPRWEHPKTYHVQVRGQVTAGKLNVMRAGMRLAEGESLAPVHVRVISDRSASRDAAVTLEMTLHQGVNRQIRRMCRDLRLHVLSLCRVAQGPVLLGDLPPGAYRPLNERELAALRSSLDLSGKPT